MEKNLSNSDERLSTAIRLVSVTVQSIIIVANVIVIYIAITTLLRNWEISTVVIECENIAN